MRTGRGIEAPPDFPVSSSAHTLAIVAGAGTTCSTATGNAGAIAIVDGCNGPAENFENRNKRDWRIHRITDDMESRFDACLHAICRLT